MHCATIYRICSDASRDVFSKMASEARKEARKVCISAILHTDNAMHFKMVKEISQVYELNMEACEEQAGHEDLEELYLAEVLVKEKSMWMELLLHFCDISNPLKPFALCKQWAW